MRVLCFSLFFLAFSLSPLCFANAAEQGPKPWIFSWWPSHFDKQDFNYYVENARHTHNSQWNDSLWTPEMWLARYDGNGERLIHDWYHAGIITAQYDEDDVPVLEVGPGFYRLGGQDKRRVAATVDHIYGITAMAENSMMYLYDWNSGDQVGLYTRYGLQMQ